MKKFLIGGAFVVVLALAAGVGEHYSSYRPICLWLIPSSYRGWVLVERGNPSCRAAKLTLTKVIFVVDASGRDCFSTPLPGGPQPLSFRQIDPDGKTHGLELETPGPGVQVWGYEAGGRRCP